VCSLSRFYLLYRYRSFFFLFLFSFFVRFLQFYHPTCFTTPHTLVPKALVKFEWARAFSPRLLIPWSQLRTCLSLL